MTLKARNDLTRISKSRWLWRQETTSWCLNSVIYCKVVYCSWHFVRSKLCLPLQSKTRPLCHCFLISGFTSMNLVNVLVRFINCYDSFAPSHISNMDIHRHIFLLRKKKISGFENAFFFHFICVVVNTTIIYMTYNWPNSAFFNFQKNANQVDCRQYSCILFFIDKLEQEPDEERIDRWTEFFHKLDNTKWKMRPGAHATKQNYISVYISVYMKTFLKTGVYVFTTTPMKWKKKKAFSKPLIFFLKRKCLTFFRVKSRPVRQRLTEDRINSRPQMFSS